MKSAADITIANAEQVLGAAGASELLRDEVTEKEGHVAVVVAIQHSAVIDHLVIDTDSDGDYSFAGAGDGMYWADLDDAIAAASAALADRVAR